MNGWFRIQEGNKYTSEQIDPLYLSIDFQRDIKDKRMIEHIKKYEPIGCRDLNTYKLLLINNIKVFFQVV